MLGKGIFVTGTDTGVGKTQVAFGLAAALQRRFKAKATQSSRMDVGLWKPVQTGVAVGDPDADSYILRQGSGFDVSEEQLVTMTLPDAVAPWVAARRVGATIDMDRLVAEGRRRLERYRYVVVEGAGGLAVPLTDREMIAHLALRLDLPLLIVSRPGLGTVNHTVLTVSFAREMGLSVKGVVINGAEGNGGRRERGVSDAMLQENMMMIEQFSGVPVLGLLPWSPPPPISEEGRWMRWRDDWVDRVIEHLDWGKLWC